MLIRFLLILFLVISSLLVFLQNQQLVSLKLWGFYTTPSLSLGSWIILFTLAGVITGLFWQLLVYLQTNQTKPIKSKKQPENPPKIPLSDPPKQSQSKSTPVSEWENSNTQEEDWYIVPPQTDVTPKSSPQANISPKTPPATKPPEQSKDTTYSYSYREATPQQRKNRIDQVYDANYRVITPPYKSHSDSSTEKEENDDGEWI